MKHKSFGSSLRKNIFITVVAIVGIGFTFQLIKMQILEHKSYVRKSDNNSVKKIMQQAPRGIFFDRNYQVLVSNKPSYTLQVIPAIYDTSNGKLIENILELKQNTINALLYKKRGYSKFLPRVIQRNVAFEDIVWFEEHSESLKGVSIIVEMQRDYSFDIKGSQVFGYLREINSQQLKDQKDQYNLGDFIGIKGAERAYENYLRGRKGHEFILVDSRRKTIGKYLEGSNDIAPTKGYDLVFTIDASAQKIAEKEFQGFTGSLVAIEPTTGGILAYVSAPDYNLGEFASVTSQKIMNQLRNDSSKPLFDRASSSIYPPGSTYKMLAALIGLEEGLISKTTSINCKGGFQYGNRFFKCHGSHGATDVISSIENSCNTFYYKLILDIGLDRWAKYLRMFGFGSSTGFDLGNDSRGIVPDSEYYNKVYGEKKWSRGNLISLGIGQGELSVTTLQLAQYTAFLANFGKTKKPHIAMGYLEGFESNFFPFVFDEKEVKISKKNFEIVREGMYKVVNGEGTATHIKLPNIVISGKTGTSQNPHGEDHALFVGFAPYENPKIAVAVIVENVGFGGTYAAPIAQKVIKAYLENLDDSDLDLVNL
jgi:penicillin-binding protein 2